MADLEQNRSSSQTLADIEVVDYSKRAQWLRAAVLGANDGLLSTSSIMMGIGAVRTDAKSMILTGIAGLIAGACSMAIGEFVSVYSQYDIEMAQIKRDKAAQVGGDGGGKTHVMSKEEMIEREKALPSPFMAAAASAVAFAGGAMVPLLSAAFVKGYRLRIGLVVGMASLALVLFGMLSASLGRAPLVKSSIRVLVGGWLAMGITFGFTRLVGSISHYN
ncbi:vacuolar iron transporter homolog 3-like [Impatiens glandulifera]|uniref:vacuolar iron transporter homolog 3-like n=1 Tax=Impatiens glandulifera TaxID=253017 RepID=UPI001FB112E1|nr:vacuolar iron transporter homolog 3-like [Impatiens glandulifera]